MFPANPVGILTGTTTGMLIADGIGSLSVIAAITGFSAYYLIAKNKVQEIEVVAEYCEVKKLA